MSVDRNPSELNPYVQWLGLPKMVDIPNHYELLGLELFESDPLVIKQAYYRRIAKVSLFQHGPTARCCEKLLHELAGAKDCLFDDLARTNYDILLKKESTQPAPRDSKPQRIGSRQASRSAASHAKSPVVHSLNGSAGPRENYSEGARRKAALCDQLSPQDETERQLPSTFEVPPASRSPFGIMSIVRTPAEIFKEIVAKRGLTPYQAEQFVDQNAEDLIVGPYVLESELGIASCGACFVAARISSGEIVSLRVLPSSYSRKDEASIKNAVRTVKQIASERMQRPIDFGFDGKRGYVASNFIVGEDLFRLVKRTGPLSVHQSLYCIVRAIEGLAAATKYALTHKELRPSKLIINRQGALRVRDIAIAQTIQLRKQAAGNPHALIQAMPRHHLDYVAPEVLLGEGKSSFAADLYSLGCILFFLLTAEPMYPGVDPLRAVIAHREAAVPLISSRVKGVPAQLDELFARMVAKLPKDRFESYGQCHAALRAIGVSLPKTSLTIEQQWSLVDEASGANLEIRPAMQTISIPRLFAISVLGVAAIGGAAGSAIYVLRANEDPVQATGINQPQPVNEPQIIVPRGDQNLPVVESEDSFLIR